MGQGGSKRKEGGNEASKGSGSKTSIPAVSMSLPGFEWGYSCDLCRERIPGLRYACSECPHFDICPKCKEMYGHEHLLYEETLHPQQIFDQLHASPTTGQALLKMFELYENRRAFAYREPIQGGRSLSSLATSAEQLIEEETSESRINVNLRGDNKLEKLNPFQHITFGQLGERVKNLGAGLRQLVEPRQFVCVCSHVQLGWYIADYACQINSIIGPTLGPTLSVEALVHIINSTKMTLVFCARNLTERFLEVSSQCPTLKYIIQIEDLKDYQLRPKVQAATDGLRQSAKQNWLKISQSGRSSAPSASQPSPTKEESTESSPSEEKEGENTKENNASSSTKDSDDKKPSNETSSSKLDDKDIVDWRNMEDMPALLQAEDVERWKALLLKTSTPVVLCISDLERLGQHVATPKEVITGPDELETLVYTSGSTGIPKGAMFTAKAWHGQLCHKWASAGVDTSVTWSISDRKNDYRHLYYGGCVAIYNGEMSRIFEDISEIKPHQLNATPAFWNKIYAEFKAELAEATKHLRYEVVETHESLSSSSTVAYYAPTVNKTAILDPNQYTDPVEFRSIRDKLLEEFRMMVGGKVEKIVTGGAPTSPEVMDFMLRCFKCKVRESYGSTECGGIVSGGFFVGSIQWKLVSWEEYKTDDKPFARGELCVRRGDMMSGYYGEKELTEEALDADGYYHTGDIVELNSNQDGATIIDRKKNIFKLSQGEYVAPAKIEKLLVGNSPFVKQVFVYGDSFKSSLVAVIVPHKDVLLEHLLSADLANAKLESTSSSSAASSSAPKTSPLLGLDFKSICERPEAVELMVTECARIGRKNNLRSFEIPAALVLSSTEFTKENGLYTQSDKPARHALLKYFQKEIERLYQSLDSQHDDTKNAVYKLLGKTLAGPNTSSSVVIDPNAKDEEEGKGADQLSFVQMGGDSLSAVKLRNMIKKEFNVALPVDVLLNPKTDLSKIATYIDDSKRSAGAGPLASEHLVAPSVDLRTLMVDSTFPKDWSPAGSGDAKASSSEKSKNANPCAFDVPISKWEGVFVTGATGFLGTALVAELLKSTGATIYVLMRPRNKSTRSAGRSTFGVEDSNNYLAIMERRLLRSGLLGDSLESMSAKKPKTISSRIVPVLGQLDSVDGDTYRFGLSKEEFEALCDKVQVVIHAGADVNSVLPYHRLVPANVGGTKSCLNMLSTGNKRKLLVHISTSGLTQGLSSRTETPIRDELFTVYDRLSRLSGYNLSKTIAEMLVWEAVDRHYSAIVVRPGFIASSSWTGFSNENDYDNRLLMGVAKLGTIPQEGSTLIAFPVDFLARVIVQMASKHEETCGRVYHLVNNASELTSELIAEGLEKFGFKLNRIPFSNWQQIIREMTDETNPIFPMVEEYFSYRFHRRSPHLDTTHASAFINANFPRGKFPRTDIDHVTTWIRWLINNNLLPKPSSCPPELLSSPKNDLPSSSTHSSSKPSSKGSKKDKSSKKK